jgi:hypothetical protein
MPVAYRVQLMALDANLALTTVQSASVFACLLTSVARSVESCLWDTGEPRVPHLHMYS